MQDGISAERRFAILVGLTLALVVPLLRVQNYAADVLHLDPFVGREVFFWGLAALVLLWSVMVEGRGLASIGLRKPDWKTVVFGVVGAGVILGGAGGALYFLTPILHLVRNTEALQKMLDLPYLDRVELVVRAAVVEEILFRGYAIERLQEFTGSRVVAAVVSLAAFTFAHLAYWGWTQLIFAGAAGLVLTVLYMWRRDLVSNMIAHFLTDAAGLLTR
jgi:membrane protease YdiL (CAAX protease family)